MFVYSESIFVRLRDVPDVYKARHLLLLVHLHLSEPAFQPTQRGL